MCHNIVIETTRMHWKVCCLFWQANVWFLVNIAVFISLQTILSSYQVYLECYVPNYFHPWPGGMSGQSRLLRSCRVHRPRSGKGTSRGAPAWSMGKEGLVNYRKVTYQVCISHGFWHYPIPDELSSRADQCWATLQRSKELQCIFLTSCACWERPCWQR